MATHGIDCEKVPHDHDGYLHGEADDRAYDVDGCLYCGRCHESISRPGEEVYERTPEPMTRITQADFEALGVPMRRNGK